MKRKRVGYRQVVAERNALRTEMGEKDKLLLERNIKIRELSESEHVLQEQLNTSRARERVLFRALKQVLDDMDSSPVSMSPYTSRERSHL